MAALYVACFVSDDANQLVRRLRLRDRARVDEHMLSIDHERVEGIIVDKVNLDIMACNVRRLENRPRVIRDKRFGFRVPDEAQLLGAYLPRLHRGESEPGECRDRPRK